MVSEEKKTGKGRERKRRGRCEFLGVVAGSGAGHQVRKEAAEELRWPAGARVVGASGARGCRRWTRESGEALVGGGRLTGFLDRGRTN